MRRASSVLLRAAGLLAIAAALWPELERYRAEHSLAEASGRLESVLRTLESTPEALAAVERAEALARASRQALPADQRPPLLLGISLVLQGQTAEAVSVLDAAIAQSERPELVVQLGRARAAQGDAAGAHAAYLRAAWASPNAIDTLPAAMRETLLQEVAALEAELRAGGTQGWPALR